MRNEFTRGTLLLLSLIGVLANGRAGMASDRGTDIVVGTGDSAAQDRDALQAAVAMLPKHPIRIAVIDVTQNRPEVRDHLLTLDAFTVNGNGVIYVVQQSAVLRSAHAGSPGSSLYRAILATILWHEMAHLTGADEHAARKAEEELWGRFTRDGVADQVTALRYLALLQRRPDDQIVRLAVNDGARVIAK